MLVGSCLVEGTGFELKRGILGEESPALPAGQTGPNSQEKHANIYFLTPTEHAKPFDACKIHQRVQRHLQRLFCT